MCAAITHLGSGLERLRPLSLSLLLCLSLCLSSSLLPLSRRWCLPCLSSASSVLLWCRRSRERDLDLERERRGMLLPSGRQG